MKTGEREISYYDIRMEDPYLNSDFDREIKELREFAILGILTVPREQVLNHLQRLKDVEHLFYCFCEGYNKTAIPADEKQVSTACENS